MVEPGFVAADYVELFFDLFQHTSDAVSIIRVEDSVVLDVNESFLSLYGLSRERAIGRPVLELGLWVSPHQRASMLSELMGSGRVIDFRARMRSAWSEEFTVSASEILTHWRGENVILGIARVVPSAR